MQEQFAEEVFSDSDLELDLELMQQFEQVSGDKFVGEKNYNPEVILKEVQEFFKSPHKYKDKRFLQHFKINFDSVDNNKSVCAKIIERGQNVAECFDCQTDHTCIICMDCYKNSNHEGHRVVIKKAYGGCCDCGDIEAWKKEGFCKHHTGEAVDIQIGEKEVQRFIEVMEQLMYLYFREISLKNSNHLKKFGQRLIDNLVFMNQMGVYFNKLTFLLLQRVLDAQKYRVSANINSRTVLANLLHPRVTESDLNDWVDLFMIMFQYYPFKKLLLATYINHFTLVYDSGADSVSKGTSISCQLLTSYQLVKDYAQEAPEKGHIPIGANIDVQQLQTLDSTFLVLFHDLSYIPKLQGDTPLTYFRFHVSHQKAFMNMFAYVDFVFNLHKRHQEKTKNAVESTTVKIARYLKYIQLEFKLLEMVANMVNVLKHDKEHLLKAIRYLFQFSAQKHKENYMVVFEPHIRTLVLFLYAYFDMDLNNLLDSSRMTAFVEKDLALDREAFDLMLSKIFKSLLSTFMYYGKIQSSPGLNSTMYGYLYFYRIKTRFMSSIDLLGLKIFSLMHGPNQEPVISPKLYLQLPANEKIEEKVDLNIIYLNELNLISSSFVDEIYVAYQIDPNCELYQNEIEVFLIKLLNQQKGPLSLDTVKEYEETFFHPNAKVVSKHLKKLCDFDKNTKIFTLKKQYVQEGAQVYFNFKDFRSNLTNKSSFINPDTTRIKAMKNTYNEISFHKIFSVQTLKKLVLIGCEQAKNLKEKSEDKAKQVIAQLCRLIYIKKAISRQSDIPEVKTLLKFLGKVSEIESLIDPFYRTMVSPEKMDEQESEIDFQMSAKKSQKHVEAAEDEKKRLLKLKMQKKKKLIKEKYAKNSAVAQQKMEFESLNSIDSASKISQKEINLHSCIVCRNDNPEDMIYLVKAKYRNHQKLLKMNKPNNQQGTLCLSLQSCYHPIDYECFEKLETSHTKRNGVVKCPFCKFSTNTYLPINPANPNIAKAMGRLQATIFSMKEFDEISILEEVMKSFYHFSLLSYIDPQRTLSKKLKIYQLLLAILKQNKQKLQLEEVLSRFNSNKTILYPKILNEDKKIKRGQMQISLKSVLNAENVEIDDLNQMQLEQLMNFIESHEGRPEQEQQQGFVSKMFKQASQIKEKLVKKNSQTGQGNEPKSTQIMRTTFSRIFEAIGLKVDARKDMIEEREENHEADMELASNIEFCLKHLLQPQFKSTQQKMDLTDFKLSPNYESAQIKDLPMKYRPLSRFNRCDYCEEMTPQICICLLCDWKGCIRNCMQNKQGKGGSLYHSKEHGEASLYLNIHTCQIYNISVDGGTSVTCLYQDEWGNDFKIDEDWDQFTLDESEYQKVKANFLNDE